LKGIIHDAFQNAEVIKGINGTLTVKLESFLAER